MPFSTAATDERFLTDAPKRYEQTFAIPRPAAQVWEDLTADAPLSWCRALGPKGVTWTSPRPFGVGTTRQARVLKGLLVVQERYFAWDEGHRQAFAATAVNLPLVKRLAEEHVLEPDGPDACTLRWLIAVQPTAAGRPGGPLNAAIFRSFFKDTARHYGASTS